MKKITLITFIFAFLTLNINAQLSENFDGETFPPSDWTMISGGGPFSQDSSIADHTTGSGFYANYDAYNISNSTPAYLETPKLEVTDLDKTFSFWTNYYLIAGSWGSNSSLTCDVSSDNGTTWTTGTTNFLTPNSTWEEKIIDLSDFEGVDFTGNNVIVRFVAVSDYGSYNIALDDVSGPAVFVPACPVPTDLAVSSITASSASLLWTPGGTETEWEYVVQAAGTGEPTEAGTATTANPISLSGLTANTDYEIYLRAVCDPLTSSSWVSTTLTTACLPFTAPYSQDFENAGVIPDCWTMSGDEPWIFSTSGGHVGNDGAVGNATPSGGYFAFVDDSTPDNTGTTLLTPFVDVSGLTTPALVFYLLSNNEGYSNVNFSVDVYDGAAWNTGFYTSNSNTADWVEIILDLSSLSITGPIQARFIVDEVTSGDFYDDVAIDDVQITELPTCATPTSLTVDSVTTESANLSWTSDDTNFNIEVVDVTAGGTATGTATYSGVTNPYVLTGLSDNNAYVVYVQADCGTDVSQWTSTSFTTLPSAIVPDYTNDFSTYPGDLWSEAEGTIADGPSGSSAAWGGSGGYARINLYTIGDIDWLISPEFDLSSQTYYLNLDVSVTEYSFGGESSMGSDDLVSLVMTTDGTTWTILKQWSAADNLGNTFVAMDEIVLGTSSSARFALHADEGAVNDPEDYYFNVDNFNITSSSSLGINDLETTQFTYFPNPVNDQLTINAQTSVNDIAVLNMLGQVVLRQSPNSLNCVVDMAALRTGVYFVQVSIGNKTQTVRVLKQ